MLGASGMGVDPMKVGIAVMRLLLAASVVAAVAATALDVLSRGPLNPFNFFGYFTMQSNIFLAAVLAVAGVHGIRGSEPPPWLGLVRGLAVTYIVIVGIVYATLLAPFGAAGGVQSPWANFVLHVVTPILATLDWLLIGDRDHLPMSRLLLVMIYPAVWLAVVLIRGATDGWVPYPFLDPVNGYGLIAVVCLGVCAAILLVGWLVFRASRSRLVKL